MKTLVALLLSGGIFVSRAADTNSFTVMASQTPSEWNIRHQDKPLMVYSCAPGKYKPYVKELYTTRGYNVLRDAPEDHLHHHALMYGIRVNGLNFWEETAGNGVQKAVGTPAPVVEKSADGREQVVLTQLIHWVAPQDAFLPDTTAAALLVEKRTLILSLNQQGEEVALEWKADFQVGAKTNTVVLAGANYHGLGVRFLRELDPLAQHSVAGKALDLSGNRQDLSAGAWAAVSFPAAPNAATLVIAGSPSNARGDARFFSMKTPFAYLSATQSLEGEPLVYRSGDSFSLKFMVLLYSEVKSAGDIGLRVNAWRKENVPGAR
jgi:hypothetical protein